MFLSFSFIHVNHQILVLVSGILYPWILQEKVHQLKSEKGGTNLYYCQSQMALINRNALWLKTFRFFFLLAKDVGVPSFYFSVSISNGPSSNTADTPQYLAYLDSWLNTYLYHSYPHVLSFMIQPFLYWTLLQGKLKNYLPILIAE